MPIIPPIYLYQKFIRYYKFPENIFSPKADTFTCTVPAATKVP